MDVFLCSDANRKQTSSVSSFFNLLLERYAQKKRIKLLPNASSSLLVDEVKQLYEDKIKLNCPLGKKMQANLLYVFFVINYILW